MSDSEWLEHARERLGGEGHRSGGARAEIVDLLARQTCCLTPQQIYERLRADDRKVGLASVYRALELLSACGLVRRVDVDGATAFEPVHPSGDHHHHIVCSTCGRVDTFEDPALERAIAQLAARLNYAVAEHDVTLRGACQHCMS